jgi:hypothetical protein
MRNSLLGLLLLMCISQSCSKQEVECTGTGIQINSIVLLNGEWESENGNIFEIKLTNPSRISGNFFEDESLILQTDDIDAWVVSTTIRDLMIIKELDRNEDGIVYLIVSNLVTGQCETYLPV